MSKNCFTSPSTDCKSYTDSHCVYYSGSSLSCLGVATNERLDSILSKIDSKLCTGVFSLYTQDSSTLSLFGSGTESQPLYGEVKISEAPGNGVTDQDGLYVPQTIKAGVVYGGVVTWESGYTYTVSAAGYYINGVFYNSPETSITLSPADSSFNRIDTFIVDINGEASVLEGDPTDNPAQAPLDPATQLELSLAVVEVGTTQPGIAVECIYKENEEWSATASTANINPASSSSPFAGVYAIEATSVTTGNNLLLSRGSSFVPMQDYTVLTFKLKAKSGWGSSYKLLFRFMSSSTAVGNDVVIAGGFYGFNISNTTAYQTISIPLFHFGLSTNTLVDKLRITADMSSGSFGWFIDNICFQDISVSGVAIPTILRNGLTLDTNTGVGELGGSLIHNTVNYTAYYTHTFSGATIYNYPYQFQQGQNFANSTGIASFLSSGAIANTSADYNNTVRLGVNYTSDDYGVPGIEGYLGSRIGYMINSNATGNGSFGMRYDDANSKITGIFFNTKDNSTEGISLFARTAPLSGTYVSGMKDYIFLTGHTNKNITLPGYPNTRNDGALTKALGTDVDGNLILGTISTTGDETDPIALAKTITLTPGTGISISQTAEQALSTNPSWTINSSVTQYTDEMVQDAIGGILSSEFIYDDATPQISINQIDYSKITGAPTIPTQYTDEQAQDAIGSILTDSSSIDFIYNDVLNTITATIIDDYVRGLFSAGTGIGYNSSTGVISSTITQYTDALARAALSLTTTGASGAATYNSSTGVLNIPNYSGLSAITANNGLTANTSSNVQLGSTTPFTGSPLLHDTYLNADIYSLHINGSSLTTAFIENTSSGVGLYTQSSTGFALKSFSNSIVAQFQTRTNTTNSIEPIIQVQRRTFGTPANGLGGSIDFYLDATTPTTELSNQLISKWTDAAFASRTSQLEITGVNAGTTGTILSAYSTGVVGIGNFSSYNATRLDIVDNTLAGANMVSLSSTSTAAAGNNQVLLKVNLSGANTTASQVTKAGYFVNTHTGTGNTNYGIQGEVSNGNNVGAGVYGLSNGSQYGVSGVSATGAGVNGQSSSGVGGQFSSTSNTGLTAATTTGGQAFSAQINPTSTNTFARVMSLSRLTSATAANGIGGYIEYAIEKADGVILTAGNLGYVWSDANGATPTSEFQVHAVNAGASATVKFIVKGNGVINIPTAPSNYTDNTAALAGGLVAGDIYRNGDQLMIVH